jgi:hypothetical protein
MDGQQVRPWQSRSCRNGPCYGIRDIMEFQVEEKAKTEGSQLLDDLWSLGRIELATYLQKSGNSS